MRAMRGDRADRHQDIGRSRPIDSRTCARMVDAVAHDRERHRRKKNGITNLPVERSTFPNVVITYLYRRLGFEPRVGTFAVLLSSRRMAAKPAIAYAVMSSIRASGSAASVGITSRMIS